WLFDIQSHWAQAGMIAVFCVLAGHNAAEQHPRFNHAWIAASVGLICACALTLPWLIFTDTVSDESRSIIPLGSMVAANAMNAVAILFNRLKPSQHGERSITVKEGLKTAMISPINTLKVVGLVHMPGIFVGMVLAGSPVFAAITMQLVVLYMVVASSFIACVVSFLMMKHLHKGIPEP
ncbi:MAG: ABC transporter permease, partial [Ghiorsea sp.]